ncbi:hypothetical protein [Longimycelium tulufanense]|uniref:hypothetical protein n=1 Tax=Longimycelium tulufanense TaxID=907463 RepID=UPI00166DC03F|nr:hypothetical protein [Longimycelium tulufanense]
MKSARRAEQSAADAAQSAKAAREAEATAHRAAREAEYSAAQAQSSAIAARASANDAYAAAAEARASAEAAGKDAEAADKAWKDALDTVATKQRAEEEARRRDEERRKAEAELAEMHEGATDFWDGNWLLTSIVISVGGFAADLHPALRAEELRSFRSGLEDVCINPCLGPPFWTQWRSGAPHWCRTGRVRTCENKSVGN